MWDIRPPRGGGMRRAGIGAGFDGHDILPGTRLTIVWITGGAVSQIYSEINRAQKSHAIGITFHIPAAP
jgi:hypothetical protein